MAKLAMGSAANVVYGPQPVSVWAADILANIGAPHTQNNVNNIAAWQACEGGQRGGIDDTVQINNLFNTEFSTGRNGLVAGTQVSTYPNYNTGLWATLMTMRQPFASPIISALRSDASRPAFANAVAASKWGTLGSCIAGSTASAGMVAGTGLRPAGPVSGFKGGRISNALAAGGCVPSLILLPWALARVAMGGWAHGSGSGHHGGRVPVLPKPVQGRARALMGTDRPGYRRRRNRADLRTRPGSD